MISLSRLKEMEEEEMENKIKELEEKLLRKEQEKRMFRARMRGVEKKTINQARIIYELKNKLKKVKIFNNEIKSSKNELFNTWKRQLDELNKLKADNQKYRQVLKSIEFCLQTIKRVDGNSFDEALTNEFDFMVSKIREVEDGR